ncbi:MAG TPA: glycosyltransferase family 4 protein [Vicinamibacterales bacterium]
MVTGAYWPELSGGGLQCRTMIHALKDRFRFRVFTTCTDRSLPLNEEVEGIPVTRAYVDVSRPRTKLSAMWSTVMFFLRRQGTFEIVHLHGFSQKSVLLVLLARLFGKKVVITIHTAGQDEPEAIRPRGWLAFKTYASADRFIAISPAMAENYRRSGLPADRLVIAPNAVDTTRFAPLDAAAREQLRSALNIAPNGLPWLLFVGFFSQDKAPRVLFDAWLRLIDEDRKCALIFVGATESTYGEVDPAIAESIRREATARGLDRLVHFAGPVREVERYYQAADVYVMPSVREAFGMSLVEAMASGIPVIATRIPGVTDAIIDDQRSGILVQPRDVEGFAAAIRCLMDDSAAAVAMGANARDAVRLRFSLDAAATRWAAVYEKEVS